MYYEIRSQAKPLRVSVGYHHIAKTLVTHAIGNSVTIFHFDFTKAVSHLDNREIFEMYQGTFKDDGDGRIFPNAVAQALAGAADGTMTSVFLKVCLLLYSPKVQ